LTWIDDYLPSRFSFFVFFSFFFFFELDGVDAGDAWYILFENKEPEWLVLLDSDIVGEFLQDIITFFLFKGMP